MSRSVRAETRQSKKDESKKHHVSNLFSARKWEKKWVTICDTTMRIYKWVPVNCTGNEQAKKNLKQIDSSQSSMNDKENSKITRNDEDSSNTCFSFSEIQFQNSSDKFLFSEDSNSQSSDTIPVKKFKSND